MKLKEINRPAIQSWGPAQHYPTYLATGTSAQQLDASFSTNASLEIFELDLAEPSLTMRSCGMFSSPHKYHKLVWGPHGMDSQGHPSGVLIAGGDNGDVIVYDPAKIIAGDRNVIIASSDKHTGPVRALDINSFQTNLVASGGNESEIYIWDLNTFGSPMTPGPKPQPLEDISSVAWNRQVQHILASASPSGRVSVWDLRKNDLIIKVSDHSNKMHCSGLAWNPEVATQLVLASEDDRMPVIQMWDLRFATSPLKILENHTRGVLAIAWSLADPELLLSCAKDNRILCWNPNTAEVLYELPTSTQWCFDIQWCPRNPAVLSAASFDGHIGIYSIMGGGSQAREQRQADQISTSFGNMDPFGTGQTLPPLQLTQSTTSTDNVTPLKKPPRWIRKPVGASFAFGGKLVSLENTNLQQPFSHRVHISQVVTETVFLDRSKQLQAILSTGKFAEFCQTKIDATKNEFEKTVWSFLKISFEDDARGKYLELLGYKKEEIASKIAAALEGGDAALREQLCMDSDPVPAPSTAPKPGDQLDPLVPTSLNQLIPEPSFKPVPQIETQFEPIPMSKSLFESIPQSETKVNHQPSSDLIPPVVLIDESELPKLQSSMIAPVLAVNVSLQPQHKFDQISLQPGLDESISLKPVSDESISLQPGSNEPMSPQPGSDELLNLQPVAVQEINLQPGSDEPMSLHPGSNDSISLHPGSNDSISLKPVSDESISLQPVSDESISLQPVSDESISLQPVSDDSIGLQPVSDDSIGLQPESDEPISKQLGSDEPISKQLGSDELICLQPVSDDSISLQPGSDEPISLQPVSDESISLQPVSDESISLQPVSDDSIGLQPESDEPISLQPRSDEPISKQLGSDELISLQPVSDEPISLQPGSDEPISLQPVADESLNLQIGSDELLNLQSGSNEPNSPQLGSDETINLQPGSNEEINLLPGSDEPISPQLGSDEPISLQPGSDGENNYQLGFDLLSLQPGSEFDQLSLQPASEFDQLSLQPASEFDQLNLQPGSEFDQMSQQQGSEFNKINLEPGSEFDQISLPLCSENNQIFSSNDLQLASELNPLVVTPAGGLLTPGPDFDPTSLSLQSELDLNLPAFGNNLPVEEQCFLSHANLPSEADFKIIAATNLEQAVKLESPSAPLKEPASVLALDTTATTEEEAVDTDFQPENTTDKALSDEVPQPTAYSTVHSQRVYALMGLSVTAEMRGPVDSPKAVCGVTTALSSSGVHINACKDLDGLITQALLTGDFDGAVELCLNDNRMADSIILAMAGGPALLTRTQKKYFAKKHSKITKLISAVVLKDLGDILQTCDLLNWKEALAAVMTYAQPQEFSSLCDLLGSRLETSKEGQLQMQACLCYICAGNVEKLVACWTEAKGGTNPLSLLELVEKVVVLRQAVKQTQESGPTVVGVLLAEKMSQYSSLLASQGSLATAMAYLPENATQKAVQQLYDRLTRALGKQPTAPIEQRPSAHVSGVQPHPANNPGMTAMEPQSTPVPVEVAVPPCAPTQSQYYQPSSSALRMMEQHVLRKGHLETMRPASTVTSWSNQTPTALLSLPPQASDQQAELTSSKYGIQDPASTITPPAFTTHPCMYNQQYQPHPQVNQYTADPSLAAVYQHSAAYTHPSLPPSSHYLASAPSPGLKPQYIQPSMGLSAPSSHPSFLQTVSSSFSPTPVPTGESFQQGGQWSPASYMPPPPPTGTSGPQNGWNDPPTLSGVPKKKKALNNYTPPAPITAPIMVPLGVDPQGHAMSFMPPQPIVQSQAPGQLSFSGNQQPLSTPPMNPVMPKTSGEGAPGAPIGDAIQPMQSITAEKILKKPIPDEHLILKTTFEVLIQKCLAAANDPQTKRKLDDANKRLETLHDKLREQTLSPAILRGLHNMVRCIESRSYSESINIHTHIVSNNNFSETSAFMPVLKVVLTQANRLGV